MLKRSALMLAVLVSACAVCAQTLSLDKCLDDLAANGKLPGPTVAVVRGPDSGAADLSSPEGAAKTFGLTLFDQDGIRVLGPAECIHLYDVSESLPVEPPKAPAPAGMEFLRSLTDEQIKAAGSSGGLQFDDLSPEQQAIAKRLFSNRATLMMPAGEIPGDEAGDDPAVTYNEVYLSGLPTDGMTITGQIVYNTTIVGAGGDQFVCGLETQALPAKENAEYRLLVEPEPEQTLPQPPKPTGPNKLKPSDLDYSRAELRKQAAFEKLTTLKDAVDLAAKESGLPLFAGPGAEKIGLYINSDARSVGDVLKAVSLATGGTWRKIGDLFVYTVDIVGMGAFDQMLRDYHDLTRPEPRTEKPFDADSAAKMMLGLPVAPGTGFAMTPEQIGDAVSRLAMGASDTRISIEWESLTREQQSAVLKACGDPEKPALVPQTVEPQVSAQLAFHFPAVGNAGTGMVPGKYVLDWAPLEPDAASMLPELTSRPWPKGSKIPMPSGVRGMLRKVTRSDTPAGVVAEAEKHGLNTLLVRIFADGYAIFPSRQFPQLPGLKADDFLRNLIAVAHLKDVKVIGVVDVLRWSDGEKTHWLYKTPELLDRDITGRTNTERRALMGSRAVDPVSERAAYGDAFAGDFVSPFQPAVRERLSALIGELAAYDLDGIAFDHGAIVAPDPWEDEVQLVRPGQPGFNELARSVFLKNTGVDPVDMVGAGFGLGVARFPSPLRPVSEGAGSVLTVWEEFHRTSSHALVGDLAAGFREAKPGVPVWWLDTYGQSDGASVALVGADRVISTTDMSLPLEYVPRDVTQLIRITDELDPLYAASYIASIQKETFPGMLAEDVIGAPPAEPIGDIILDFACSEKRRAEFLRLLETSRPE